MLTPTAGLVRDVPIEWNPYSEYGTGNKNETNRSIMWESLDVSRGSVSLDMQWAKDHGLPPSQPFPGIKVGASIYLTATTAFIAWYVFHSGVTTHREVDSHALWCRGKSAAG